MKVAFFSLSRGWFLLTKSNICTNKVLIFQYEFCLFQTNLNAFGIFSLSFLIFHPDSIPKVHVSKAIKTHIPNPQKQLSHSPSFIEIETLPNNSCVTRRAGKSLRHTNKCSAYSAYLLVLFSFVGLPRPAKPCQTHLSNPRAHYILETLRFSALSLFMQAGIYT